jgi:hypothetical protein
MEQFVVNGCTNNAHLMLSLVNSCSILSSVPVLQCGLAMALGTGAWLKNAKKPETPLFQGLFRALGRLWQAQAAMD